jgi:hypothetical protein
LNIIKLYVSGLILYLATIVGYVPIHKFRIFNL